MAEETTEEEREECGRIMARKRKEWHDYLAARKGVRDAMKNTLLEHVGEQSEEERKKKNPDRVRASPMCVGQEHEPMMLQRISEVCRIRFTGPGKLNRKGTGEATLAETIGKRLAKAGAKK